MPSKLCEKQICIPKSCDDSHHFSMEKGFTAKSRMGCTDGMADALYRLELDLAGHQGGIARSAGGARNDCGLADDFWRSAIAGDWIRGGGESATVSLERVIDLLFALSRSDRFCTHVSTSVLASAKNVGRQVANSLVDHATWRCHVGLGCRRGKIFSVVASGRLFRACRCLDDFPQSRSDQASNARARRTRGSTAGMI